MTVITAKGLHLSINIIISIDSWYILWSASFPMILNDIVVHVLRYCFSSCYNCLCYYIVNRLLKHVNNLNKLQNSSTFKATFCYTHMIY